jgi:hypothetical protein
MQLNAVFICCFEYIEQLIAKSLGKGKDLSENMFIMRFASLKMGRVRALLLGRGFTPRSARLQSGAVAGYDLEMRVVSINMLT